MLRYWVIVRKKMTQFLPYLSFNKVPPSVAGHRTNLLSATAAARFIRLRSAAYITSVRLKTETILVFVEIISGHLQGCYRFGCLPNGIIILCLYIYLFSQ